MQVFPNSSAETIAIGATYLRISLWLFWGFVALFVSVSALQGLKKPLFTLVIGLIRQIVLPISVFYILIEVMGVGLLGIWWGLFGIVWFSAVVTLGYVGMVFKRLPKNDG